MVLQLKLKVEGATHAIADVASDRLLREGEFNIILRKCNCGRTCYTLLGDGCDYDNAFVRTCGGQDELISTDRRHNKVSVDG